MVVRVICRMARGRTDCARQWGTRKLKSLDASRERERECTRDPFARFRSWTPAVDETNRKNKNEKRKAPRKAVEIYFSLYLNGNGEKRKEIRKHAIEQSLQLHKLFIYFYVFIYLKKHLLRAENDRQEVVENESHRVRQLERYCTLRGGERWAAGKDSGVVRGCRKEESRLILLFDSYNKRVSLFSHSESFLLSVCI